MNLRYSRGRCKRDICLSVPGKALHSPSPCGLIPVGVQLCFGTRGKECPLPRCSFDLRPPAVLLFRPVPWNPDPPRTPLVLRGSCRARAFLPQHLFCAKTWFVSTPPVHFHVSRSSIRASFPCLPCPNPSPNQPPTS
ncbi:unnamed protein product, partial [Scytosiphon promiscuus]